MVSKIIAKQLLDSLESKVLECDRLETKATIALKLEYSRKAKMTRKEALVAVATKYNRGLQELAHAHNVGLSKLVKSLGEDVQHLESPSLSVEFKGADGEALKIAPVVPTCQIHGATVQVTENYHTFSE